jgi:hypothetical protein
MTLKMFGITAVAAVAITGFVLSTSPAKAELCSLEWKPVCGTSNGVTLTYSNACQAKFWHATVVSDGVCGSKPAKKVAKKMKKK